MAVNGIGQYDLFKQYSQNIDQDRIHKINSVENQNTLVQGSQTQDIKIQQPETQETLSPAQTSRLGSRTNTSDLEDISLVFHKDEEKNLQGRDSKLADLDVEKAISDMRKDSILEQYQYFVGEKGGTLVQDDDGVVFQKFDPTLTMT